MSSIFEPLSPWPPYPWPVPDPNNISVSKTILNEEERPRVLIATERERRAQFKFVETKPGSFRYIDALDEVDLREWDAVVIDSQLAQAIVVNGEITWWGRLLPLGLNVFFVHDPEAPIQHSNVLDILVSTDDHSPPAVIIEERLNIPGKHARRIDGLPDDLQSLVHQVLVPLMDGRAVQFGYKATPVKDASGENTRQRPFVVGPDEVVIAGSHSRGPDSEVWILPSDIRDFEPWYELALSEWHERDGGRFPGLPGWIESSEWLTHDQLIASSQVDEEVSKFEPMLRAHEMRMVHLTQAMNTSAEQALAGEKNLLSGQGDELQKAVKKGLEMLEFEVRDMDLEWDDRERREDYRIADPDVPGWLAVSDATGVAKGVKGSKLNALAGFTTKYVLDERPTTLPFQWLIVNHFINRDPNTRPSLLRPDDLKMFASNQGLAIDTTALFLLIQFARAQPASKQAIREYLRGSTGQIGLGDARAWIALQEMN